MMHAAPTKYTFNMAALTTLGKMTSLSPHVQRIVYTDATRKATEKLSKQYRFPSSHDLVFDGAH